MRINYDLHEFIEPGGVAGSITYHLNGTRVYIDSANSIMHVGTDSDVSCLMGNPQDSELVEFAVALSKSIHGSIKVDMSNWNIQKFLKVTKCV